MPSFIIVGYVRQILGRKERGGGEGLGGGYFLPHPIREQLTEIKKLHRTNQDSNDFSSKMDPSILLAIRKWSIDKVRSTTKEKGPSSYKLRNSTNVNVNDNGNYLIMISE